MRYPALEAKLNKLGIVWQYHESVPFSKFNLEKGRQNQARVNDDALDGDLVRQYRDAIKRGEQFPAVVTFEDGNDLTPIDGNHRLAGHEAVGTKSLDTYEVLCDPEERLLLTLSLNSMNGRPNTEDDRDRHAVALVEHGFTREAVASELHIPKRRIEEAIAVSEAQIRANRLGRKSAWAKITTKSAKQELSRGFVDDSVFAEAVTVVSKYELGRDASRTLRQTVDALGSEAERLKAVQDTAKGLERDRKKAAGKRVLKDNNPRAMSNAHMEYIIQHLADNIKAVWLTLTPEEKQEIRTRVVNTRKTLVEVEEIVA